MNRHVPTVETERLRLVPLSVEQMKWQLDDFQKLERSLGLPESNQSLANRLRSVIEHDLALTRRHPDQAIWYTYWVMILKANQRLIGGLGFKGPADRRGEVEIGYGVNEEERSKGYMTEAVAALVRWALAQDGVAAVRAEMAHSNVPSMRVLAKVGFVPYRATDRFLYWRITEAPQRPPQTNEVEASLESGQFSLYDLAVVVEAIQGNCTCNMNVGDSFYLRRSSNLSLPEGGHFCIYALQAVLPLLPAKQRRNHPADWMETDSRATCPDPACGLIMRIDRTHQRTLHHDEVSPIPWDEAH